MHPTALVRTTVDVVAVLEVAEQMTAKPMQQPGHHRSIATGVVLVVTHRRCTTCTQTPDVTVPTIFTPACLVAVDHRLRLYRRLQGRDALLYLLAHPLQKVAEFAVAQLHPTDSNQTRLYLPQRLAQALSQVANERGQPYAHTPLTHHMHAPSDARRLPSPAHWTSAHEDLMFDDFYELWFRQLNHLSPVLYTLPSQVIRTTRDTALTHGALSVLTALAAARDCARWPASSANAPSLPVAVDSLSQTRAA